MYGYSLLHSTVPCTLYYLHYSCWQSWIFLQAKTKENVPSTATQSCFIHHNAINPSQMLMFTKCNTIQHDTWAISSAKSFAERHKEGLSDSSQFLLLIKAAWLDPKNKIISWLWRYDTWLVGMIIFCIIILIFTQKTSKIMMCRDL